MEQELDRHRQGTFVFLSPFFSSSHYPVLAVRRQFRRTLLGYAPVCTYIQGLIVRSQHFITEDPEVVDDFAEGWGFIKTPWTTVDTIKEVKTFADECAARGECKDGASLLLRDQPVRFAKGKILAALDRLESGQSDALIKVSRLPASWTFVVTDLIWTQTIVRETSLTTGTARKSNWGRHRFSPVTGLADF